MGPEAERIGIVLRSLSDVALRTAFLLDYIGAGDAAEPAHALDEWCGAAARAEAPAREPALAIAILLASLGDHSVTNRLGQTTARLGLVHLGRLLRRAPELLSETDRVVRVPEYSKGRELSLGERKALARRPSRAQFDKLIRDPHPLVIAQLLANPHMTENDVVRLAALRPGTPDALRAIARTPWLSRSRVRMALIHNPASPSAVAVPLLAACTRTELLEVRRSHECSAVVRETAQDLLDARDRADEPQPSSSSSS